MKQKKLLFILGLAAGIILLVAGAYLNALGEYSWKAGGICMGIGAACFAASLSGLVHLSFEQKYPETARQERIDMLDERNVLIHALAQSKVENFCRWIIFALAWVNILMDGVLWMTLALIGIFFLTYCLEWYYAYQYQKKM